MKLIQTIVILVFTLSAFGQAKRDNLVGDASLSCYKGKAFNLDVFVKMNDSIAVMDWFYEEKVPRCFFSDTLSKCNTNDTIWKSSMTKIYRHKRYLYLFTINSPYEPNVGIRVKLKPEKTENWETIYFETKKYYSIRCIKR